MDATRYLIMSGLDIAKTKPDPENKMVFKQTGWMG